MICEQCGKKEATVHWTEVVNNAVHKTHLCAACAAAKGLDVNNPDAFTNVLLGLSPQGAPGRERPLSCPMCRMRMADFKKTSRLGCQACYEAFAEELKPLLEAMHKGGSHVGKKPSHAACRPEALMSPALLRKKLEELITAENYEEAATLRDLIRRCEGREKPLFPQAGKDKKK